MKKSYTSPCLVEYGTVDQLTLGANGPQTDYTFAGGALNVNSNSPGCTTNGPVGCVSFAS
jgi:hypothetical protein